ncbi:hypothetical protein SUGI_0757560 [Cryptomeria japonica]|uniref:dormancy-associated protein 1 isoform X2 n=1 Tax=Cryptomeria japonica TaxID=3369 RepID=UPI002414A362|nr:dormancy-associated protein 1 isoform X2 [Cryptomeria japonica]XP_059063606.1 dormancy-associated protein 1 isoform X1 [Cryptomeria japonica]GLJ37343.1 hypothetical protein SUGI_0757560 [Cryptomeria japonica]
MGLLDQLWDDVVAGPQPHRGLGKFRKSATINSRSPEGGEEIGRVTKSITIAKHYQGLSLDTNSVPSSPSASSVPSTPSSPSSSTPREKENVWRSVFHPGSNKATGFIGSQKFDNAQPNSPTVYDWLYSGDTKSKYR